MPAFAAEFRAAKLWLHAVVNNRVADFVVFALF
jgi:hypothetical protein